MTNIPIRREAIEVAGAAYVLAACATPIPANGYSIKGIEAAIAAFCEAEGLMTVEKYYGRVTGSKQRLVGKWRDAS